MQKSCITLFTFVILVLSSIINPIGATGAPAPLSGTFTIGGTSPDYATITEAIADLSSEGVEGPTTFLIRNGSYVEQVSVGVISGASADNPITFRGENLDSSLVVISYDSPSTANYLINLNNSDYLTFEHLTFESIDPTYGRIFNLIDTVENLTIQNCTFLANSTGEYHIYGNNIETFNLTVQNCRFENNGHGIFLDGTSNGSQYIHGLIIDGNIFNNTTTRVLYTYLFRNPVFTNNQITSASTSGSYKIHFDNAYDSIVVVNNIVNWPNGGNTLNVEAFRTTSGEGDCIISGNEFTQGGNTAIDVEGNASAFGTLQLTGNKIKLSNGTYGIQYYYDAITSNRSLVANNFVYLEGSQPTKYAFYGSSFFYTNIYHNTFHTNSSNGNNYAYWESCGRYSDLVNNVFAVTGNGYPLYVTNCYSNVFNRIGKNGYYSDNELFHYRGNTYNDFETYQNTWVIDSTSIFAPPFFLSSDGFEIAQIQFNGIGLTGIGISNDITGQARDLSNPDIGCAEFTPQGMDAGISSIGIPDIPFAAGIHPVSAMINNYGSDILSSVEVVWEVNGEIQDTVQWTGSLASDDTTEIVLGNFDFPLNTNHSIKAWTILPNAMPDPIMINDTEFIQNVFTGLGGTYTLGGTDPDIDDWEMLENHLRYGGVYDPVFIEVRDGTYTEQISFRPAPGSSSDRPIVIRSESGDSSSVVIQNNNPSNADYVIRLLGIDHISFEHLTFQSLNTTYSTVMTLVDTVSNLSIRNCSFLSNGTGDFMIFGNNIENENTEITDCLFDGNGTAIYLDGTTNGGNYLPGLVIEDNRMVNQLRQAIYTRYYRTPSIQRNYSYSTSTSSTGTIKFQLDDTYDGGLCLDNIINWPNNGSAFRFESRRSSLGIAEDVMIKRNTIDVRSNYGLFITGVANANGTLELEENIIRVSNGTYGIQYYYQGTSSNRAKVINNYIFIGGTSTKYGFWGSSHRYSNIYHNSVNVNSTSGNGYGYWDVCGNNNELVNNAFTVQNGNGYAFYTNQCNLEPFDRIDHNAYYVPDGRMVYRGAIYPSLEVYQNATSLDSNSLYLNAFFLNDSSYQVAQSGLQNNGLFLDVNTDIEGQTRDPLRDIGADEFDLQPTDAGIMEIVTPEIPFPADEHLVYASLKNFGTETLTSVDIHWTLDDVAQPVVNWTGSLASGDTILVELDLIDFQIATKYKIDAHTQLPNGGSDAFPINDSTSYDNIYAGLSGTYTIGGTTPDFTDLYIAQNELNFGGVYGPVDFEIRDGIYDAQLVFQKFPGSSASNKVTFKGESGDSSLVTIQWDSPSTNDYTIRLNGTDHIGFEDLTFGSLDVTYSSVILLQDTVEYLTINNCAFESVGQFDFMIYGNDVETVSPEIKNSLFSGNGYGVYLDGTSNGGNYMPGTLIENNTFENQYYTSIYTRFHTNQKVLNNKITHATNTNNWKVYLDDAYDGINFLDNEISAGTGDNGVRIDAARTSSGLGDVRIEKNEINILEGVAIDLNGSGNANGTLRMLENKISVIRGPYGIQYNYTSVAGNRALVANNFIHVGGTSSKYGFYATSHTYTDIFHNTINITSNSGTGYAYWDNCGRYTDLVNNIFNVEGNGSGLFTNNCYITVFDRSDYNNLKNTSGNVVVYRGSSYTSILDYTNAWNLDSNSVSLAPLFVNDTTDLHVTNVLLDKLGTNIPNVTTDIDGDIRDIVRPDMGADEFSTEQNDISVIRLDSPSGLFPAGNTPMMVTVLNNGLDTLRNFSIDWEINGEPQIQFDWVGEVLSGESIDSLNLGSYPFEIDSNYTITLITKDPNGEEDGFPQDDTLQITNVYAALGGTYTIGGTDPDFESFNHAITALNNGGVIDSVNFEVRNGLYNERLIITEVEGASEDHKITFQSEEDNLESVELNFASSSTDSSYVIILDGADHFHFKNMTINSTGAVYARVVNLKNFADHNSFEGNRIQSNVINTTSDIHSLVNVNTNQQNNGNEFLDNHFIGGATGIYYPSSSNTYSRDINIIGNTFTNQYRRAMYMVYSEQVEIKNNVIDNNGVYSSYYGIELVVPRNELMVDGNTINLENGANGIYISSYDDFGTLNPAIISNNYIVGKGTSALSGISVTASDYVKVLYNTVRITNTSASSNAVWMQSGIEHYLYNNNLVNFGPGRAIHTTNTNYITDSDYNNLFSNGATFGTYGTATTDLTSWQSLSGFDANSISIDPLFENDSSYVTLEIELDNAGTPVDEVTIDIEGETRDLTAPDIGVDEFTLIIPDDIGIVEIISPTQNVSFSGVDEEIVVVLRNNGSNQITSGTINSIIDNVVQFPFSWSGELDPGERDTVIIGTTNLSFNTPHDIISFSSEPNGVTDNTPSNDTSKVLDIYVGLIGMYTIGGILPDFNTIGEAVNALNNGGVLGEVEFRIRNGTYNEQLLINEIAGVSAQSPVKFTSESGDPTLVNIEYTGTSNLPFTIRLNGSDYITFENLTISSLSSNYGSLIYLQAGADYNVIQNNILIGHPTTSDDLLYSPSNSNDVHNQIIGNTFIKGGRAIDFRGVNGNNKQLGTLVLENVFVDQSLESIYLDDNNAAEVLSNTITFLERNPNSLSIYLNDCDGKINVSKNVINRQQGSGISFQSCNALNSLEEGTVTNNVISIGGTSLANGMYLTSSSSLDIFYNSIHMYNTNTSSKALYCRNGNGNEVINNILANSGNGYALYVEGASVESSNNNNLYTTGSTLGYWVNANQTDLSSWQSASNKDVNSVSLNPLFFGDDNLHILQVGLDGAAQVIPSINLDYEGDLRNASTPDIGADEFDFITDDIGIIGFEGLEDDCALTFDEKLTLIIQNYGGLPQSGFDVELSINNEITVTENITRTVPPGDTIHYFMEVSLNLSAAQTYAFEASTNLIGDLNIENDQIEFDIQNYEQPAVPTNLLPADGQMNVGRPINLSWLPSAGATLYDLYIWADSLPQPTAPYFTNLTQISAVINSLNFTFGVEYAWQVVAKNPHCNTPSAIQTFVLRELPDLISSNIQVPSNPFSSQEISVSWNTDNIGIGATLDETWYDQVYLSPDNIFNSGIDNYLGAIANLTALEVNESYAQSLNVTLPQGIAGTWYLFVVPNGYNSIPESNTLNNPVAVPIQISLTPPPDLQVTQVIPPNNAFSGTEIMVTYEVTNEGEGDTEEGTWRDYIYISDNPMFNLNEADLLFNAQHNGDLAADESYQATVQVELPDEIFGDYFIHVFTDRQSQVYEFAFEDNNVGTSDTVNIFLTPPPDLELTSFVLPDTLSPSQSINTIFQVSNVGATPVTDSWRDRIYISEVDTFDASSIILSTNFNSTDLIPGTSYLATKLITIPSEFNGEYYIYYRTDYRNSIFEFNSEANNFLRTDPLTIIAPDLQIGNITAPSSEMSGQSILVSWETVNGNRGNISNKPIIDSLYLSLSPTLDASAIPMDGLSYNITLGPSGQALKTMTANLPNGVSGNYYLHVKTDAAEKIFEADNENNNSNSIPIAVTLAPSPDLQVTGFGPLPDTAFTIIETVPITLTVANMGAAATSGSSWKERLYLSIDPVWNDTSSNNYLIEEFQRFTDLDIGGEYTLTLDAIFPMVSAIVPGGDSLDFYLYAVADFDDEVYEHAALNQNNVLRSDPIFLVCPPGVDLKIGMLSIIPTDTLETSQDLTLSWMIENIGPSTSIWNYDIWYDGVYLSNDPIWDPDDLLIEDFTVEGPLDSLEYYTDEQTITIPEVPSGHYCLMLVADNQEYLNEESILNNNGIFPVAGPPVNIYIKQKPASNLVAKSFTAPVDGVSGQPIEIVFKVKNEGPGAVDEDWVDKIYLSTDFTISNSDQILYTNVRNPNLAPGEEYLDTVEVFLPIEEEGNFILLFKTDANNRIFEMGEEGDNSLFTFITIDRDDPSDLVVENANIPTSALVNEKIDIIYDVKNIGQFPASGVQRDLVYLSQDSVFDVTDVQLGIQQLTSQLAPNASEERTIEMLCTPGVPLGDYHVIVQTDALNNIYEVSDVNNVYVSPEKINIQVPELPIDVLTPNTLTHQQRIFYRIEVPAALDNETMRITLLSDILSASNEMYLSYGEMPTRSTHDFSHRLPFSPNQEVTAPELDSGTYYLHIYGETDINTSQEITVIAEIIEFSIFEIDRNTGGNTGTVTAKITGAKFSENMTVTLHDDDLGSHVATSLYFLNSTEVFASFNLGGASLGQYDVILENPGGAMVSLTDGFEIVEGPAVSSDVFGSDGNGFVCSIKNLGTENLLSSNIIAPSAVRVGRVVPITIQFGNNGAMDIPCPQRFILSVRGAPLGMTPDELPEMKQELLLLFEEPGGPPGILRPGATGSITIYTFSSHPLRFYIQE